MARGVVDGKEAEGRGNVPINTTSNFPCFSL